MRHSHTSKLVERHAHHEAGLEQLFREQLFKEQLSREQLFFTRRCGMSQDGCYLRYGVGSGKKQELSTCKYLYSTVGYSNYVGPRLIISASTRPSMCFCYDLSRR